jgi:anaerobic selenocysteine-containing dehydrogenase
MHNIEALVKGKSRCTLQIHPDDASRLGVVDGGRVRVTSRVGNIDVVAEVTQDIRSLVVSLPHGWGHGLRGTKMQIAAERSGTNTNILTDQEQMDPLSGNAVLNGIPVTVELVTA